MSSIRVRNLQAARERRRGRFDLARALHTGDPERASLLADLHEAVGVARGDRGAIAWWSDFEPSHSHTHVVLDLGCDTPRRKVPVELLARAWTDAGPGRVYDLPSLDAWRASSEAGGIRSACCVPLDTDGGRTWFVVVDGRTPRGLLTREEAERLLFLCGKCAGVVLHRDMESPEDPPCVPEDRHRFAGWPLLEDVRGLEGDEEMGNRVTRRFLVGRAICHLLDEDLSMDPDAVEAQVRGILDSLGDAFPGDPERGCWEGTVAALRSRDYRALASNAVALASWTEEMHHLSGARELYRCAYLLAMMMGIPDAALRSARSAARVCGRMADEEAARAWEGVAQAVAPFVEDQAASSQGETR